MLLSLQPGTDCHKSKELTTNQSSDQFFFFFQLSSLHFPSEGHHLPLGIACLQDSSWSWQHFDFATFKSTSFFNKPRALRWKTRIEMGLFSRTHGKQFQSLVFEVAILLICPCMTLVPFSTTIETFFWQSMWRLLLIQFRFSTYTLQG